MNNDKLLSALAQTFRRYPAIERAVLFGSRARGEHSEQSDYDVAVYGALTTAENIRKATILALYSGADFIKTSTGKGYPGATPEAVYTICKTIKQYFELTNQRIGIKISGGIRTAEDAVKYYTLVKEILGKEWLNKELFRIGASNLVSDIEHRLGK